MRKGTSHRKMAAPEKKRATYADLEAVPPHLVAEIIDGVLVTRSHGHAVPAMVRTMLSFTLRGVTQRRSNPDASWQIVTLPELHLGSEVLVPELAAWAVRKMPFLPDDHTDMPPDWVCELVSDDVRRNPMLTEKIEICRHFGVRHVWIVDLTARRLSVIDNDRHTNAIAMADCSDDVSAPPFDAISFSLADLWPLDRPLGLNEDPTPYYAGDR